MLSGWIIILILASSALIGGIVGFVLFNKLFMKKREVYFQITPDNLSEEIINMRSRIQVIYIIGPMIGLVLTMFGMDSIENVNAKVEQEVKERVNTLLAGNSEKLTKIEELFDEVKQIDQVITEGKLMERNFVTQAQLRTSENITKRDLERYYVRNVDFGTIAKSALPINGFLDTSGTKTEIQNYVNDFNSKILNPELIKLQGQIAGKANETRVANLEAFKELYDQQKGSYLQASSLKDLKIPNEGEVKAILADYIHSANLASAQKLVEVEAALASLREENEKLTDQISIIKNGLTAEEEVTPGD